MVNKNSTDITEKIPMVNFMDFYYTGPDTLAGRYMRKFWQPVYRTEDLKPGWAKPIKISVSNSPPRKNPSPRKCASAVEKKRIPRPLRSRADPD